MLTLKNARSISERFIRLIRASPESFQGRGIVIPAGGLRYLSNAWVCIKMLRRLGCSLPIQLWHLGSKEMDDYWKSLMRPLGVECIDALEIRKLHPARILEGYVLKPYAILHSPFKEVLLLDADNVPVVNPEFLFESPQFKETGAVFWPDFGRYGSDHPIWDICGVPYRDEPEFESGQMVLDKARCWKALSLAMWYNEHSDFYYHYILGDKDTFHMAFRKLNQVYCMPDTPLHPLEHTMCQHDFNGNRAFQHRNLHKWNLFGYNKSIDGFWYEDECRGYLDELRQLLEGHWKSHFDLASKSEPVREAAKEVIDTVFDYHRVGYDRRPMTFLENGIIGAGHAGCEVFWDLKEQDAEIVLEICSDREVTCMLKRDTDNIWRGQWVRHEQMPVELSPLNCQTEK